MTYLSLALLILALLVYWLSSRQRKATGLPEGRVIYTDTRLWGRVEKPLYDQDLRLTGKPDYLVKRDGHIIPVEVKTGHAPEAPYDSHIFQLACYCLLVERTTGQRPPFGIIHYDRRDFAVDYTPELESSLLAVLSDVRRDELSSQVSRSHDESPRCLHCGFHKVCDQHI